MMNLTHIFRIFCIDSSANEFHGYTIAICVIKFSLVTDIFDLVTYTVFIVQYSLWVCTCINKTTNATSCVMFAFKAHQQYQKRSPN